MDHQGFMDMVTRRVSVGHAGTRARAASMSVEAV